MRELVLYLLFLLVIVLMLFSGTSQVFNIFIIVNVVIIVVILVITVILIVIVILIIIVIIAIIVIIIIIIIVITNIVIILTKVVIITKVIIIINVYKCKCVCEKSSIARNYLVPLAWFSHLGKDIYDMIYIIYNVKKYEI